MTVIGLKEARQKLTDGVGRHGKAHLPAARRNGRGLFSDRVDSPGVAAPARSAWRSLTVFAHKGG